LTIRKDRRKISSSQELIGMIRTGEEEVNKKTTTYQEDLIESLKDIREAAAYLNAAMEEADRALFLLALRNVAEAQGGMAVVAEKAQLNRENLYRMLSKKGNPEIKSIVSLLHSMGLRLTVEPRRKVARPRVKKAA
jgi:probable addiction module antidote protein